MQCRVSIETVSIGMSCEVHSTTAGLTCQKECDVPTWCPVPCGSGAQAALLILAAAATWARIVTPRFRTGLSLRGLDELHEAFGWLPSTPQRGQLGDVRTAVGKEAFIAGTEVVETCFTVWGLDDAIFRASPVAHSPDVAFSTIPRQRSALGLSKGVLRRAFEQFEERGFTDIAQAMLRGDKVIARIEIPVVFDDRDIPAGGPKNTQRMVLSVGRACRLLEHLHDDPPDVLPYPLIKDGTEKRAKRLRRHGARAHAACRSWLPLDKGNKADVLGLDLLEKAVHLQGILDILRMHDAQDIDRDFMLAQQAIALHHLLVGRLLALGHTVRVVQRRRTVEAEPDSKAFRRKKAAPVVIEEIRRSSVCRW